MSQDLANLYIRIDSSGVVTASKNLDDLTGKSRTTEKATQSMSQSFLRMAAAMGVGMSAAQLFQSALKKTISLMKESVMLAARYETLGVVMRVVGSNAGYSGAQMEAFAKGLEKTGISMVEARQTLTSMVQANLDLAQSSKLARIAQDAAVIGNINSSEAFERMVYGIQSAQVEMLRTIGINVNFENSYQQVAKATGRVAAELSETEKSQIRLNVVMEAGKGIAGTYEAAMDTAGKQALSMQRHVENLKVALGTAFTPALAETIETITGALVGMNGELTGENKTAIENWGANFRLVLISIEAEILRLAMLLDKIGGSLTSAQMLLYGPGKALGVESSTKRFNAAADNNIMLENRYNASDKRLQELANKYNKIEASMTAAGKAAKEAASFAAYIYADWTTPDRPTATGGGGKASKTKKEKSTTKKDEFDVVDLWLKDEARKWEELEAYEKKYNEDKLAAQSEYYQLQRDLGMTAQEQMLADQEAGLAKYQALKDQYLITDEQYQNAKKLITEKTNKDIAADNAKQFFQENEEKQQIFSNLAGAFKQLGQLYKEDSRERRAASELSKAATIAEIALQAQKNLMIAVGAVANQANGDPYTAFARVAAMVAVMSSVLSIVGIAFNPGGGGGGGSSATKKTSTALGSEDASESVSNSYELLKDSYSMQYERLTKIYGEMKDLNSSITGLVTSIVRTGGMNGLTYATGVSLPGYSSISTYAGKQASQLVAAASADPFTAMTHNIIEGLTGGKFGDNVAKFINSVFGGGTETKLQQQGLSLGNSSIGAMLSSGSLPAQYYSKIKTTTEGGWFGSDDTKTTYMYDELDAGTSNMLNKVFGSLSNTFFSLAEGFGLDTQQTLDYVFAETKLNLKGKTAEEINTILTDYFNTTADNAAQALFGNLLGKYQQLNEGMLETATRVLRNKEIIEDYVTKTNKAFTGSTEEIISFTEAIVDFGGTLDDLTDNINTYIDAFYSEAERQAMLQQDLMEAMGGNMPGSRSGFRAMVEGLDLTTEAGQRGYATMMKLAGEADKYYSFIEEANEKAVKAAEDAKKQRLEQITTEFEFRKSALTDLYNSQLDAAKKRLSDITETVNKLSAARDKMKVQDAAIEALQFRGAKSNLMRGVWDDKSLETLTAINPGQYSTRQAYLRDYGEIYNQLGTLEADALGKQSAAEQQVAILQSQYELDLKSLEMQRATAEAMINVEKAVCGRSKTVVPAMAEGGWVQVGEAGPELVKFGSSARVISNKDSKSLLDMSDVKTVLTDILLEVKRDNLAVKPKIENIEKILQRWETIGPHAVRT